MLSFEVFSWILNYYDPNKHDPNSKSVVLDTTCSEMLMWHSRDFALFIVKTNDVRHEIKADYHYNCESLYLYLNVNPDILKKDCAEFKS